MAGFLHKKSYINIGLIYNITTRLTHGTGTGLGWVPQTRPVPVPTQPIPGYPRGFTNPCYALVVVAPKVVLHRPTPVIHHVVLLVDLEDLAQNNRKGHC